MASKEFFSLISAVIILTIVFSFSSALNSDWNQLSLILLFSTIIISLNILAKKITAHSLDTDVSHSIWDWSRYGLNPHSHLKNPIPIGTILPIIISLFSLGIFKVPTILTYEARALKRRAAKRFGFYSYTELTEWHNSLIGASGIFVLLLLALIAYLLPVNLELLAKMSAYYAFFNLLPISNLDGTQIFFGSRILWTALSTIALIFALYALVLI